MKKIKNRLTSIIIIILLVVSSVSLPVYSVRAEEHSILPTPTYSHNSTIKEARLTVTDDGYMRVFYDGEKIGVEYYDDNLNILSKKWVDMELTYWGGFYAGEDAYYIVVGQANKEEDDNAEVIRIIKYNKNWDRIGAAHIKGNSEDYYTENKYYIEEAIRYPFDAGCVEMTECDGKLYVVTGHQGYVDPSEGQGHQGLLMIEVDTASMTGNIVMADLNHSFAQFIECDDSALYLYEQSDGDRCTKATKINKNDFLHPYSVRVLPYGGFHTSAWAIACYSTVNDMTLSSDNVLGLGTSIDQSQYDNYTDDMAYNIYITVTPKEKFSEYSYITNKNSEVKWLTDYSGGGKRFTGAYITKVNDDRFMISWGESSKQNYAFSKDTVYEDEDDLLSCYTLHYLFVDGNGNKISDEFTAAAPMSPCHPVVKDSKIVFYANTYGMVNFYIIDSMTGDFSKKIYRTIGENVTWDYKDGVLKVSGSGPIYEKYGVGFYSMGLSNPVIKNTTKIEFEGDITSVPKNYFTSFDSLTEVNLSKKIKSIGEGAFNCRKLQKITIPDSVEEIGDDFIWSVSFSGIDGEILTSSATIYAHEDSYAAQYAREKNLNFEAIPRDDSIKTSGIYCYQTYPSIIAGLVVDNKENIDDDIEYRWLACNEADEQWFEVSPWTKNNEWIDWTPENSGNYVFVCYARLAGDTDSQIEARFGTPYNKHIKEICQMPYWGEGGGYLIGFESYDNPNQEYQYEMFVMDLTLYSQGIENCWVHRTMPIKLEEGANPSDGKTLWTIWQPEYGYYLTLFRLYDKDGNTIDEVCYGFVNAY